MLNLGSTSPDPACQPDCTTPAADAGATFKSEPSVFTTGTTSPCVVSSANGAPRPHVRHSPVMERHATSSHCTALQQESPAYEDCTQQMEGQQAVQVQEAEAEAEVLLGTTTGPESGQLQQPSGRLGHVGAAVEMQEQATAVKASVEVFQVPGPLQGPSGQQRGRGPAGSVQDGAMNAAQGFAVRKGGLVNAMQQSLHGIGGQIGGSSAKSPGERGVVHSAQGRERTEAARRGTRNSLLLSLHRVAVTDLPQFQDLPIQDQNKPL